MVATDRSKVTRFTSSVARRNSNLIKAVELAVEKGTICPLDICNALGFSSRSTGRLVIKALKTSKLIEFSHSLIVPGTPRETLYYKTVEGATEKAKLLFPTENPQPKKARRVLMKDDVKRIPKPAPVVLTEKQNPFSALFG